MISTVSDVSTLLLSSSAEQKKINLFDWLHFFGKEFPGKVKTVPSFIYTLPLYGKDQQVYFFKGGTFYPSTCLTKEDVILLEFLFSNVDMIKSAKIGRIITSTPLIELERIIANFSGISRIQDYIPALDKISFSISNTSGKNMFLFSLCESIITTQKKIEIIFSLDTSLLFLVSNRVIPPKESSNIFLGYDVSDEVSALLKYLNSMPPNGSIKRGISPDEVLKDLGIQPWPKMVTRMIHEMLVPGTNNVPFIDKFNIKYLPSKNVFTIKDAKKEQVLPPLVSPKKIFSFNEKEEDAKGKTVKRKQEIKTTTKEKEKETLPEGVIKVFGIKIDTNIEKEKAEKDKEDQAKKKEEEYSDTQSKSKEQLAPKKEAKVEESPEYMISEFIKIAESYKISMLVALSEMQKMRKFYKHSSEMSMDRSIIQKWFLRKKLKKIEKRTIDEQNELQDQYFLLSSEHEKIKYLLALSEYNSAENETELAIERMEKERLSSYLLYPLAGVYLSLFYEPITNEKKYFYEWKDFESQVKCINNCASKIPELTKETEEIMFQYDAGPLKSEPMDILTVDMLRKNKGN